MEGKPIQRFLVGLGFVLRPATTLAIVVLLWPDNLLNLIWILPVSVLAGSWVPFIYVPLVGAITGGFDEE